MLSRISDVLQSAADVLAPPPTALQDFEYHWKLVKNFYTIFDSVPKVHINDSNVPHHLEQMLQILINEDTHSFADDIKECHQFLLNTKLLDLLVDLAINDSPPGAQLCILNWIRRYLSCLKEPRLDQSCVLQPINRLIELCNGEKASPYEKEQILFLETVAGLIRKEPILIHLFVPAHQHSIHLKTIFPQTGLKKPVKNALFDCSPKIENRSRTISFSVDEDLSALEGSSRGTIDIMEKNNELPKECDCEPNSSIYLMEAILSYIQSADSTIVVRSCEAALILASIPTLHEELFIKCNAIGNIFKVLSDKVVNRIVVLCRNIPEDMDTGDIEDTNIAWGLLPHDSDSINFIGRHELIEFLCWIDYADCLSRECEQITVHIAEKLRKLFLENVIEPSLLDINASFTLVLTAKIIKQFKSNVIMDEIATWLVGEIGELSSETLLTIIIENAQGNPDVLLQTLQFIEAILDNPHQRILDSILFRFVNGRGYYDPSHTIQSWSDEEDERDRRRGSVECRIKSRTLAPSNILKIINSFLSLLPRQIMKEGIGTCYEEYVQDAGRHYQNWIDKTETFNWPIEAIFLPKDETPETNSPRAVIGVRRSLSESDVGRTDSQCGDSGIAEEIFDEGPLLRLLFTHLRSLHLFPYELNLAVIAILSKLAFLPHPYLHEILLNPEIPISSHSSTLWVSMQAIARHLLLQIQGIEGFQTKIADTAKRLLVNPPLFNDKDEGENLALDDNEPLFESLIILEEFCKELAAIAFVKYHYATE